MFRQDNTLKNLRREREREREENLSNITIINIAYFKNFKSAFSLVELSIVLIIIGLLIAAVIGGKALIEEAKFITIRNEMEEIKLAAHQYQNAHPNKLFFDCNDGTCYTLPVEKCIDDPHFPDGPKMCGTGSQINNLFTEGFLDTKKAIRLNDQTYTDYISKIKSPSKNSRYRGNLVWEFGSSLVVAKNKNNKIPKMVLQYGMDYIQPNGYHNGTYLGLFPAKFCKKLARKLESYYGEKSGSSEQRDNNWVFFETNKIAIKCFCYVDVDHFDATCSNKNSTGHITVYMFEW